jgi:uridine phosphorylase
MKLYGDFVKEDWLKAFKMAEHDVPSSMIINGTWDHNKILTKWEKTFESSTCAPHWNTIVGTIGHQQIGFANVFGGPSAAVITHQFAILGTERFIQTGYFGGLAEEVQFGDILIVTGAEMADGVSHWYLPEKKMVKADPRLVEEAIDFCEKRGYRYITGTVFTTGAIMVETKELVQQWAKRGHAGVDMETATTLAVAKKLRKQAIGLLTLSDHIIKGDTFFTIDTNNNILKERTNERIKELALYLSGCKSLKI